jgi:hypothetical protein
MNTMNLEANLEKSEAIVEEQKVPKEEAVVQTIGTLVDRYGDWHLAIGHCQQLKRRTHSDGSSRKKLVTARGQLNRHAIPALHKGHGCQGPGMDNVVRGAAKR